jgi:8-oxo-dGTP pyrophosphatase MutT (NUDIX family)
VTAWGARPRDLVLAAGGILRRRKPDGGLEVAVVHRPKYDDWSFPKGKLDAGEGHEEAALREVEEETGLRCRLEEPLGSVAYLDRRRRPKEVRYWAMAVVDGEFAPNREVDELRWLDLRAAAGLLSYAHDAALVERLRSQE